MVSNSATTKAWNACEFCRKRKRSCDRCLPRCTTCSTKGVDCDYSATKSVQYFPPSYFLDHRVFQESSTALPNIDFVLPPSITDSFSSSEPILASYYEKIHWWMPIISKTRLEPDMRKSISVPSAELQLLVLAMKIILWHPAQHEPSDPLTRAYTTAKDTINEAVVSGVLSLRILQAQVLVAIYELGHAIYPAAYLSLGSCARYGMALGVDVSLQPGLFIPGVGDLEMEERRRTWWAILILDRCMQIGNPSLPLSTHNPVINSALPLNEADFNRGITKPRNFTLADAPSIEMGMLARMSQAAFLLGKVYHHNSNPLLNDSDRQEEYWQLDRTIRALLKLSYVEGQTRRMVVCSQTDLCFRALIALHDPDGTRSDETHKAFTMDLLKPIADSMSWDTAVLLYDTTVSVEDASPLLLSWAYEAAKIHSRLVSLYDEDALWSLAQMKIKLGIMARRWKAGEQYLNLLKMQAGI
ncbi:hypothetical protein K504DRAFT_497936 [Pleomassaria siparia CBS 279.74]|uniref:Zn(2)-C6 fungal-type domain-containing protein n=1 Tax=Pleomassaria siparia CBS 279.74 TaxID=1314801 RepID=A0A6G1KJV0_9PLEO|nr:hypothetical protein K504DRAFT_497936 [Pleomassaria siparia CBS 279.74]